MIPKKTIVILLSLLLIIACGKTETPTGAAVVEPTTTEQTITEEVHQETPPEETEEIPVEEEVIEDPVEQPPAPIESKILIEKSRKLSPELRDLLQKSDTELKSMSYVYAETPDNNGFHTYSIKGTNIKVDLFEKNDYVADDYFNVVYLDTTTETAQATCENKRRCLTPNIDNTNRIYPADYEEYRKKTPYEWIKEVDYAEIVGREMIGHYSVTKIQSREDDLLTEMWVDTRYGVPHKIRVTTSDGKEKTYHFRNMMFNTLRDSDVTKPADITEDRSN